MNIRNQYGKMLHKTLDDTRIESGFLSKYGSLNGRARGA